MQPPRSRLGRHLLWPAAWCYAVGLHADELLDGLRERLRADRPVVGVGNLTVGGSGKTPTARWLAAALLERGRRPALVTRGYGGSRAARTAEPALVEAEEPALYGDEAVLLRRELPGVPVVVGRIKARAALLAAEQPGVDTVIVDDALQHRRLARDFDLTVLAAADWRARLRLVAALLPAGRLRVPFDRLRRSDAALLLDAGADELRLLRARFPGLLCLGGRFSAVGLRTLDGARRPRGLLAGRRIVACCALARPEPFFADLERLGAVIAARLALPDHAPYDESQLARLARLRDAHPGAPCLITGKDAVKLRGRLEGDVLLLERELRLEPGGTERLLAALSARLERRR